MPLREDFSATRVTASNDAVVAGINDFVGGFLSYETRAARISAAADADREIRLRMPMPACCGCCWRRRRRRNARRSISLAPRPRHHRRHAANR